MYFLYLSVHVFGQARCKRVLVVPKAIFFLKHLPIIVSGFNASAMAHAFNSCSYCLNPLNYGQCHQRVCLGGPMPGPEPEDGVQYEIEAVLDERRYDEQGTKRKEYLVTYKNWGSEWDAWLSKAQIKA